MEKFSRLVDNFFYDNIFPNGEWLIFRKIEVGKIIWTYEAKFCKNGSCNRPNGHLRASEILHVIRQES